MSDINKAVLKVAQSNPEFAKALQAELSKQAKTAGAEGWRDILQATRRAWSTQVALLASKGLGKAFDSQPGRFTVDSGEQWIMHTGSFKNNPWFVTVAMRFRFDTGTLDTSIVIENRVSSFREVISASQKFGNQQPSALAKNIGTEVAADPAYRSYQELRRLY